MNSTSLQARPRGDIGHDLEIGDRVRLIAMPNDPNPVPPGTLGTVSRIEQDFGTFRTGVGQIGMKWDNGRTLNMVVGVDVWEKI